MTNRCLIERPQNRLAIDSLSQNTLTVYRRTWLTTPGTHGFTLGPPDPRLLDVLVLNPGLKCSPRNLIPFTR